MFIVDFTELHRRAAARQGLLLTVDAHWFEYVKQMFSPTMILQGIDPDTIVAPTEIVDGENFILSVDAGVWHAQCLRCSGFSVPRRDSALHLCLGCWHGGDIRWRVASWSTDTVEIEKLLLLRPNPGNRNWRGGETLVDIRQENIAHGLSGRT